MRSHKIMLINLHQFSTYLGAKIRAAHVAAHTPLTCRSLTAHAAAHIAAHVVPSERPEIVFSDPIHMIAYPQKIAPQKRSWRFSRKTAAKPKLRQNLLMIDPQSVARFSLSEDFPGDFHNDHRRMYMHTGDRPVILTLRNGLELGAIAGQVVDAKPQWVQDKSKFAAILITITRIVHNAPRGVKSLSAFMNTAYRRTS